MAENLDPDNIERVNENIQNLESNLEKINESMAQMAALMPVFAKQIGSSNVTLDKKIKLEREAGESLEDYTARIEKAIAAEEKKAEEAKKSKEKQELYTRALVGGVNALTSFGSALLSTEKGMTKYAGSLDTLGDTVLDVGKNFGPLGLAVGVATKALTTMAGAVLKQNDSIVKSFDSLAKMGGAVGLTSAQIYKLGQDAKFSSDTLDIFVKNAKDAGSNLIALGGSVSGGVKAYKDFVNVGDDALRQYRRLGITQEELIEAQTVYMRQQIQSGNQLRKSPEELQKASLKYIDNLNVLSELTGISIEEQQKALDIANANANFNAYKFSMEQKALELEMQAENELDPVRKARLEAEAAQTREIVKNKDEFARMAVATMDAENAAAVLASISTNNTAVLTEQNAHLEMAGMNIVKMSQELNKGTNQTAQLLGNQAVAAERFNKTFGEAAYALGPASQELQKTFGIDNKVRQTATQFAHLKNEEEQKAFIAERLAAEDKLKAAKEGKEAEGRSKDALMNTVAAQESIEREARIVKDKLLESINPFLSSTKDAALMAGALAVAAGLAAAQLSRMAAAKLGGEAGAAYADKGKGLLSGGKKLAIGGGVLAAGMGAVQVYQGRKEADRALEAGEITEEEAKKQKTEATYTGTGSAVGGVAGAALGSLVGPLGTVVGGYLGAKLGENLGSWFASRDEKENALRQKELEDKKLEIAQTAQLRSKEEEIIKTRADLTVQEKELLDKKKEELGREVTETEFKAFADELEANRIFEEQLAKEQKRLAEEQKGWFSKTIDFLKPKGTQASRETKSEESDRETKSEDESDYAGEYAEGGIIPAGKFGLVGEQGPELVVGPNKVIPEKDVFGQQTIFDQQIKNIFKSVEQQTKQLSGLVAPNFADATEIISTELDTIIETKNKELTSQQQYSQQILKINSDIQKSSIDALDSLKKLSDTFKDELVSSNTDTNLGADASLIDNIKNISGFTTQKTSFNKQLNQIINSISSGATTSSVQTGSSRSARKAAGSATTSNVAAPVMATSTTGTTSDGSDLTNTDRNDMDIPVARQPGSMSEEDVKNMIIQHEGIRYRPYQDSLGLWTVGIGHLIGDGKTLPPSWNREFSQEEVMAMFEKDYAHHNRAAQNIPGYDKLNSIGKGALTDLTFNMGPSWYKKWPNFTRAISQGDVDSAAMSLENSKWYTQVGNRAPKIVDMVENGIQAKEGGLVKGPETGYPATLHGNEVIVPLDPNSVLEKLAKTPATATALTQQQITKIESPVLNDSMKELHATNIQMMEMLSEKLDEMIDKLDSSVDIQDRILKYNSA